MKIKRKKRKSKKSSGNNTSLFTAKIEPCKNWEGKSVYRLCLGKRNPSAIQTKGYVETGYIFSLDERKDLVTLRETITKFLDETEK